MDLKNATILLIFTLCVLGLIIGVYYTEASESTVNPSDYDEVVHTDSNGTITIDLELKEKNQNTLNKFLESLQK